MTIKQFQKMIMDYYRAHGRDLPWRRTQDPYRIVVSEVMLQQTQVSRVLKKYPEFLRAFPNFRALARAPLSRVLRTWQGMGYNRRAIALKKIADMVVATHNGKLPTTIDELVKFPGIGPHTAGSIAAFAFNKPTVFIETNIRRTFLHHFFPRKRRVDDKELLPIIEKSLQRRNPRAWYFALMDYGSMLGKRVNNPNRRSRHYGVQSKFEGSNRQLRGVVLKILVENGAMRKEQIKQEVVRSFSFAKATLKGRTTKIDIVRVLETLEREGFIKKHGTVYRVR